MTRRDYVLISGAINKAREGISELSGLSAGSIALKAMAVQAEVIAIELAAANPRFDKERFMRDCGFAPVT